MQSSLARLAMELGLWFPNATCSEAMLVSIILTITCSHHRTDISWQDFFFNRIRFLIQFKIQSCNSCAVTTEWVEDQQIGHRRQRVGSREGTEYWVCIEFVAAFSFQCLLLFAFCSTYGWKHNLRRYWAQDSMAVHCLFSLHPPSFSVFSDGLCRQSCVPLLWQRGA